MSTFIDHAKFNNSLNLVARILLASLFLSAGISKITNFQAITDLVAAIGIPYADVGTGLVILLEVLGSIAIIVGYRARVAAILLGIFTIITAFLFHNYWAAPVEQQYVQQLLFFKNISIAGGLFLLASFNSGKWSLDSRLEVKDAVQIAQQAPIVSQSFN